MLDLALVFQEEVFAELNVPFFMLEEPSIIPHIKPRYYSISRDPFKSGETKTTNLKFVFGETHLPNEKQNQLGFCTEFLTSPATLNNVEIKTQFAPHSQILHLPERDGDRRQNLIMLAHGTGMAPLVSIIERAAKEQDELRTITLI